MVSQLFNTDMQVNDLRANIPGIVSNKSLS